MAASGNMQMSLDESTAAIPWELLDFTRGEAIADEPWAIRTKLLRKLRIDQFREPEQVVDATEDDGILIIGNARRSTHGSTRLAKRPWWCMTV